MAITDDQRALPAPEGDWEDQFMQGAAEATDAPEGAALDLDKNQNRFMKAVGRVAARTLPRSMRPAFRDAWEEETGEDSDMAALLDVLGVGDLMGRSAMGVANRVGRWPGLLRGVLALGVAAGVAFSVRGEVVEDARGASGADRGGPGPERQTEGT